MDIVDLVFGFFEKLPIPGWLWVVGFFGILMAVLVFHLSLGVRRNSMWERAALIISFNRLLKNYFIKCVAVSSILW